MGPDSGASGVAGGTSRFLTVAGAGESNFVEKRSRFMGFAMPVESADEAKEAIGRIAGEYHDARHVCWAYMIGAARAESMSSDNGEPSGTAGRPILGQINALGLTNVAVAVVRYFGGIKLGPSGLIAAYRRAAREALEAAGTSEGCETGCVEAIFAYAAADGVMKLLKRPGISIESQTFDTTCRIVARTATDNLDALAKALEGTGATATII
ncbi:MAG: YigZ family protein [Candidatus Amulumruptor caecigallinarius]|nr:YigZ family protein [Candidatus Amulumruptor caecigallinarius]MCM1396927.1 YigZ family protein [Candidatus Amulumruptor caecigallinarius]MCM1454129.1 YigZ family protein [bacterium]